MKEMCAVYWKTTLVLEAVVVREEINRRSAFEALGSQELESNRTNCNMADCS